MNSDNRGIDKEAKLGVIDTLRLANSLKGYSYLIKPIAQAVYWHRYPDHYKAYGDLRTQRVLLPQSVVNQIPGIVAELRQQEKGNSVITVSRDKFHILQATLQLFKDRDKLKTTAQEVAQLGKRKPKSAPGALLGRAPAKAIKTDSRLAALSEKLSQHPRVNHALSKVKANPLVSELDDSIHHHKGLAKDIKQTIRSAFKHIDRFKRLHYRATHIGERKKYNKKEPYVWVHVPGVYQNDIIAKLQVGGDPNVRFAEVSKKQVKSLVKTKQAIKALEEKVKGVRGHIEAFRQSANEVVESLVKEYEQLAFDQENSSETSLIRLMDQAQQQILQLALKANESLKQAGKELEGGIVQGLKDIIELHQLKLDYFEQKMALQAKKKAKYLPTAGEKLKAEPKEKGGLAKADPEPTDLKQEAEQTPEPKEETEQQLTTRPRSGGMSKP